MPDPVLVLSLESLRRILFGGNRCRVFHAIEDAHSVGRHEGISFLQVEHGHPLPVDSLWYGAMRYLSQPPRDEYPVVGVVDVGNLSSVRPEPSKD